MLVICDTGPLRYLIEIDCIDLLTKLYGDKGVFTTPQVIAELNHPSFPERVRRWSLALPDWMSVEQAKTIQFTDRLHDGEASAISLALERSADLVLIDERDGTNVARNNGLTTYGTLGVIALAGVKKLIDFEEAITRLIHTTRFRITQADLDHVRLRYEQLLNETE